MREQEFTNIFSVVLSLESQDVSISNEDIKSCYFIEDIFSFCITGKLVFYDRYGILEHGPFTGNEQLTIVYGEKNIIELPFDIWKISKIQQTSNTNPISENMMEIYFVDILFELYTLRRYSKSFTGKKLISTIINEILTNVVEMESNRINIETSSNYMTNFIIPYWTPMETIKWLCKRGKGFDSETPGYLCYNNTKDGFSTNVYTINKLLDDKNYIDSTPYIFEGSMDKKNKILNWSISGIDKSSTKVLRGGFWRGFDSQTKSFLNLDYRYKDGIEDSMLLGKKSLFNDISEETVNKYIGESDINTLQNIAYSEWVRRYSIQQIVSIVIRGNENNYAGQQIEIKWSSVIKKSYNKMMKGKYLVKSITHMFVGGGNMGYTQRMLLIKNAYSDADIMSLLNATKINIYGEKNITKE